MAMTKSVLVLDIYSRILSRFPQPIQFCFAYGSGVKKQLIQHGHSNMIDLIYCVDDSNKWHKSNIKRNSSHYSALKYVGHSFISRFQENSGAKVYYNTLVPVGDTLIKYGVITTEDLITDLLEWSDLYLAGRLHKPVEIIIKPTSAELQMALQLNLQSAVHAALSMLPETFTEYEFYYTISNISYAGDFRMTFGENKNKVENIVKPQILGFRNLYKPYLKVLHDFIHFPFLNADKELEALGSADVSCSQDVRPLAKLHHLNQLPRWPQAALTRFWNRGKFRQDTEDVLRAIAYDPDSSLIVKQCISDIVWKSSVRQSLKDNQDKMSDSESCSSGDGLRERYKTSNHKERDKYSDKKDRRSRRSRSRSQSPRRSDRDRYYKKKYKVSESSSIDQKNVLDQVFGPALPSIQKSDQYCPASSSMKGSKIIGPALPSDILSDKTTIEETQSIGPRHLPQKEASTESSLATASYGPALPPSFKNKNVIAPVLPHNTSELEIEKSQTIAPEFPEKMKKVYGPSPHPLITNEESNSGNLDNLIGSNSDEEDCYGPLPPGTGSNSKAQVALEERALQMKIDKLSQSDSDQITREEWMIELPAVAKKFGLGPRQFRPKAGPDFSDRSSWTDTPQDKIKQSDKSNKKVDVKKEAEIKEQKRYDEEQEQIIKKHKKHKKEKSLVEMHQDSLNKKKKEEGPSVRRPFSRDVDLKVNHFDEAQKKAILKKAQLLDDRFSKGQSKFL